MKNRNKINNWSWHDHHIDNFLSVDYSEVKKKEFVEMLIDNFFDENIYSEFKEFFWISLLDFFSITSFSDDEIMLFTRKIVWDDNIHLSDEWWLLINNEWLLYLWDLFDKAVETYSNVFFKFIPKSFYLYKSNSNVFSTTEDFLNFVRGNTLNWNQRSIWHRQTICNLIKISSLISLIKSSWKLEEAQNSYQNIDDEFFSEWQDKFDLISTLWACDTWESDDFCIRKYRTRPNWLNGTVPVELNLIWRPKTEESVLIKMISQYSYWTIDSIKDLVWFKAEVKNEKDAIHLADYIFNVLFDWKSNVTLKDKEVFFHTYYLENKNKFSENFTDYIDSLINKWFLKNSKKKRTWKWYRDMKFVWYVTLPDGSKSYIEFQIILVDNNNESWYNAHPIMHWLRVIESMIRMQWYVSINYINRVLKHILLKHDYIFPNLDIDAQIENVLNDYLKNRWLTYLMIPSWKGKWQKKYYTKTEDFIRIASAWFIPKESLIRTRTSVSKPFKFYNYDELISSIWSKHL